MKGNSKFAFLFCLLGLFTCTSCSSFSTTKSRTPSSDKEYDSPIFRKDYTDDLRFGDAVVIDEKYCKWKNEASYNTFHMIYSRVHEPSKELPSRLCYGNVVNDTYFTRKYKVYAINGYRPDLGATFFSDSYKTIEATLEEIPRDGLSISVNGLCVVDETYCIGENVKLKGNKLVDAKITGIFRDGSLVLKIKDTFTYFGNTMSGQHMRDQIVPYYIRANIIDVQR